MTAGVGIETLTEAEAEARYDAAVYEACLGKPALFMTSFLWIYDKEDGRFVPFQFNQTALKCYRAIFESGGKWRRNAHEVFIAPKTRQTRGTATSEAAFFAIRFCQKTNLLDAFPVTGDDVHKTLVKYDNDFFSQMEKRHPWVIERRGIVRGDVCGFPGYFWNNEQHDLVCFRDGRGRRVDAPEWASTVAYRASTLGADGPTGANYDVHLYHDAGKFKVSEGEFYQSAAAARAKHTWFIWDASPYGTMHTEEGREVPKFLHTKWQSVRSGMGGAVYCPVYHWESEAYRLEQGNPEAKRHADPIEEFTPEEMFLIAKFGEMPALEIEERIRWRRATLEQYVGIAYNSESLGRAKFNSEFIEDDSTCWQIANLGTFDQLALARLEARCEKPVSETLKAGLRTRIYRAPNLNDFYVSFADLAGVRTTGDQFVVMVMSCRDARVVAEIVGNAADEETTRQHFDLFWKYNRNLLAWENNGTLAQPYESNMLGLMRAAGLNPSEHVYRRGPTQKERLTDGFQETATYLARIWGWQTTEKTKQDWINMLQADIGNAEGDGALRAVPKETVDAIKAWDPNNKRKHTADRVMALMGANQMRRLFEWKVPQRSGYPALSRSTSLTVKGPPVQRNSWGVPIR